VRDALTLGVTVGVFGVSFGVLAVGAGLSPALACGMSLLVFTGGSQLAAVAVIGAGGTFPAALGSALLLGLRNIAYGVSLAPILRGRLRTRLFAAHLVVDESTAMAMARDDADEGRRAFWASGFSLFVFWNLGTFVGALAGTALGSAQTLGLDAALTAGFAALLAPRLRSRDGLAAGAGGALIALALLSFTAPGIPVIAAALAVVPALARRGDPR